MKSKVLSRGFYKWYAPLVALWSLGKIIERHVGGELLRAEIWETEAYRGADDPASYAFKGESRKSRRMFDVPGLVYMVPHRGGYMFNFVVEPKGQPGAVLIRSIFLQKGTNEGELIKGPCKVAKVLKLDMSFDGADLTDCNSPLRIVDADQEKIYKIGASERIGVKDPKHRLWRFFIVI